MNYIKIKENKLIISMNNKINIITIKFKDYINNLLIDDLTTIEGRLDAVKIKYKIYKLVPIYINQEICLIPINPINNINNIYINVHRIVRVVKYNQGVKILFLNNETIKINKSYQHLLKQIKKAKKIQM